MGSALTGDAVRTPSVLTMIHSDGDRGGACGRGRSGTGKGGGRVRGIRVQGRARVDGVDEGRIAKLGCAAMKAAYYAGVTTGCGERAESQRDGLRDGGQPGDEGWAPMRRR